jgi:uncharacterized repeat protein (TIGR01451 family)
MLRHTFTALLVVVFSLAALLVVNGTLASPAPIVRANAVQSPEACVVVSSDITTNTTWSADCYHVTTNTVAIQPGVILTIAPFTSTRIEFETGTRLLVIGNLQALGDPAHPITFTSAAAQTPCAWQGIGVPINTQGMRLQYSTIEYACAGVTSNDADQLIIMSNTFRYLGDGGVFDGAIGGDTDNSTITNNTIYSSSNGIVLNESFGNNIIHNTIYDIDGYGIGFIRQTTSGGNGNTIADNVIYRTQNGLRLEDGSSNQVLTNSLTLNTAGAIYLDRQSSVAVTYNHVYTNGGGAAYHGGIFITGSNSLPAIQHNVVVDGVSDAIAFDASTSNNFNTAAVNSANALCATSGYELRNSSINNLAVNASNNWWGTNTPLSGVNYTGSVALSDPIVLSITLGANRLPADTSATTIFTVTLRDSLNNTVPRPNHPGDPDARRVALQTTLGSINPVIVDVNDQGVATAVLTAVPQVGPGVITATAFCNYPLAATFEITNTNVAITKTSAVTQTIAGSLLTYTIAYSNPSGIGAPNVVITDVLGSNLAYVGDTSGYPAHVASNVITWALGTLPSGASGSFMLTTTVLTNAAGCGQPINNTASIATSALESTYADNTATAAAISNLCSNVAITKTAGVSQVYAGSNVTYTITYSNSTAPAPNVVITDVLPAGAFYMGDSSGILSTLSGNQIVWPIGNLPPGVLRSFILTVSLPITATNCGRLGPNTVLIGTTAPESAYADNMAFTNSVDVICADWALIKTADRPSGAPGEPIDYIITYTNRSLFPLSGAIITDVLPANTSYVSDTSGLPLLNSGGILTWTLPALPALPSQASVSFKMRLSYVGAGTNITLTNRACISSSLFDGDLSNNCSQALYHITSLVDVVVVKDDDVGPTNLLQRAIGHKPIAYTEIQQTRALERADVHRSYVRPGDIVTYTIAVVNVSAYTSTNFILTETLPLYTHLYVTDSWAFAGGRTYTQALGNVYPGTGRVLYFIVQVDPVPAGVSNLINTICGFGSEYDRTPDDNCHIEDTPLTPPPSTTGKFFLPVILYQANTIDQRPRVFFSSATYHVFENQPTALITVQLSKPWPDPVTIKYHTEDGSATAGQDYIATQGTLTFAPGETTHTFSVGIISDTLLEYWETVNLILSNPSANAKIGYPGVATLYIEDVHCVVPTESLVSVYSPMDVAYDAPTDRLYVANRDGPFGGSLKIGAITPTAYISQSLDGLLSAQGVALDTTHHKLYVVGWDWLNVLDSDGYTQTARIALGSGVGAHAVAYNPVNQKIYVTGYSDNSITIIDANTLQIRARLSDSSQHTIYEPSYIAVNTNTGKVYITNHAHGRPIGWVTVISGSADQIVNTIYLDPAGELYGIVADNVHNRLYVASINAAVIYAIDAATDTQLGYLQIRRWSDNLPVPIRMIAVNPNPGLGSKIRLWLTSSSTEDNGLDNIISLTGDWPYMEQPYLGVNLPPSPERGLKFDPTTKAVIVASASSNRVTILWDTPQTQQCLWPFVAPGGAPAGPDRSSSGLYTVVHDFAAK